MHDHRLDVQMQETAEAGGSPTVGLAADSNKKQVAQLRFLQHVQPAMVSSMFQQIRIFLAGPA